MHILMIEDNESVCEMIEMFFEKEDWEVTFVHDGKEGLDEYVKNSKEYDLIILDIQLPKLDGFELLAKLKKEKAKQNKNFRKSKILIQNIEDTRLNMFIYIQSISIFLQN